MINSFETNIDANWNGDLLKVLIYTADSSSPSLISALPFLDSRHG